MFRNLRRWLQGKAKPPSIVRPEWPASNRLSCERCTSPQTFHITNMSRAGVLSETHLCESCAYSVLRTPYQRVASTSRSNRDAEMQIEIARIVISEVNDQQVVLFREIDGERHCFLLIGIFEATALDRFIKGFSAPRPLTHDAWFATINALDASVQMASITAWSTTLEKAYLAELRLNRRSSVTCVDVRPSDAVIIALIAKAPIMMANELLTEADSSIEYGV